jgi:hypothetical protein
MSYCFINLHHTLTLRSLDVYVLHLLYLLKEPNLTLELELVFLGYPSGVKGYKLLDLHTSKLFISRDVVFHETIFPFKAKTCSQDFSTFLFPSSSTDSPKSSHTFSYTLEEPFITNDIVPSISPCCTSPSSFLEPCSSHASIP